MNEIVIDASVALRAVYPSEDGHEETASALGELLPSGSEPVAPDIFPYEIGNSIRRASSTAAQRTTLYLDTLQLVRLVRPPVSVLARALTLAPQVSFYDAAYVATAEDLGTLLWTEDAAILAAVPEIATSTADLKRRLRGR